MPQSGYPDDHFFFVIYMQHYPSQHFNIMVIQIRYVAQYDRLQIEEVATTVQVMMVRIFAESGECDLKSTRS